MSPDQDPGARPGLPEERSPFYDEPWLQSEARGHLDTPDPDLLDLVVQREEMHERFHRERGGAVKLSELSQDEQEENRELNGRIKKRKKELGFNLYR